MRVLGLVDLLAPESVGSVTSGGAFDCQYASLRNSSSHRMTPCRHTRMRREYAPHLSAEKLREGVVGGSLHVVSLVPAASAVERRLSPSPANHLFPLCRAHSLTCICYRGVCTSIDSTPATAASSSPAATKP